MLIGYDQLQAMAGAGEDQFLERLAAHQATSFPQLLSSTPDAALVRTAAMSAVAQFHGFSTQQDISVCSDCALPFVAGGANPQAIEEGANTPLQTVVADAKSVLSRLGPSLIGGFPSAVGLSALKQQCSMLAASAGSSPLNTDRSGPVVPYTEFSPVKPGDLAASAATALPAGSSATGVTQPQLTTAVTAAREMFGKAPPTTVIQECKPVLADLEFRRVYWDGTPMPKIPYTVTLADGSKRSGTTDGSGLGSHTGVVPGQATVVYGGDTNAAKSSISHEADLDIEKILSFGTGSGGSRS